MVNIAYYVVYGLVYAVSLLPLTVLYALADVLYVCTYYIIRYRRAVVRRNLVTSFPEKTTDEIADIERRFYRWLCDYFVETLKLASMSQSEMRRRMVFKNTETIDRLTHQGISSALFLGHFCNWEWVSSLPLHIDRDSCFAGELYHRLRNDVADRLFLRLRQRFYTTCINKNDALRTMVRHYREHRPMVVGYISDQKPKWQNIHLWVNFLNHPDTPVFTGTERIIKMTHHAFVYCAMSRPRRGYYVCDFQLIERQTHDMPDFLVTERYMQLLEQNIRRQPECYLWSHDRWSRTREEFDRLFCVRDGKVLPRTSLAEN